MPLLMRMKDCWARTVTKRSEIAALERKFDVFQRCTVNEHWLEERGVFKYHDTVFSWTYIVMILLLPINTFLKLKCPKAAYSLGSS